MQIMVGEFSELEEITNVIDMLYRCGFVVALVTGTVSGNCRW